MESCLYEGAVYHERLRPVTHRFTYRLYMNYIDLVEVPELVRKGLLKERRFSASGLLRRDHFGDPEQDLAESVRQFVRQETGMIVGGPIRLLTQLRQFGYYFSPLNVFYCFSESGNELEAVVAEVSNTPWLQRHCYVLWQGNQSAAGASLGYVHPKAFHVSPFMGMNADYQWKLTLPGDDLLVEIRNNEEGQPLFRAAMELRRVPLTRQSQRSLRWRFPFMNLKITAAIYMQAFRLWRKKCRFYPHPKRQG